MDNERIIEAERIVQEAKRLNEEIRVLSKWHQMFDKNVQVKRRNYLRTEADKEKWLEKWDEGKFVLSGIAYGVELEPQDYALPRDLRSYNFVEVDSEFVEFCFDYFNRKITERTKELINL